MKRVVFLRKKWLIWREMTAVEKRKQQQKVNAVRVAMCIYTAKPNNKNGDYM